MARYIQHLFVCENVRPEGHPRGSCGGKGSAAIREKLRAELQKRGMHPTRRVNMAGCLDACEQGPVIVVYPEGVWYGGVTVDDVEEIVERHLVHGEVVERLRIYRGEE